jgi:catechol 2,3-dioxygenase-like lactoylglutathione lyase family enzyme
MRIGLDHVHVFSSNVASTVGFFRTMFGAHVVWDEEAAGARNVRLRIGNAFLHIYDQPPKAPRGGAVHHIGIETDDLDALVSKMKAHGASFRNAIREERKFRYVMVSGPDDLLIELFQSREPERWQIERPKSNGG